MKVDPIHFFNERGHSIMSADHLEAENKRLQEEIHDLERKVRSLTVRLQMLAGDDDEGQIQLSA
jgi:hypothetical protein